MLRNAGQIFVSAEGRGFILQRQVEGKNKMDVLFIPGVNRAAGNAERKELIPRNFQFVQQKETERIIRIIQRNAEISQSEHIGSSSCHRRAAGSVKAFSG